MTRSPPCPNGIHEDQSVAFGYVDESSLDHRLRKAFASKLSSKWVTQSGRYFQQSLPTAPTQVVKEVLYEHVSSPDTKLYDRSGGCADGILLNRPIYADPRRCGWNWLDGPTLNLPFGHAGSTRLPLLHLMILDFETSALLSRRNFANTKSFLLLTAHFKLLLLQLTTLNFSILKKTT
ncbi:hypothetical protein Moror_8945 [Moniliophthora roreri MCA 2997]|uniref:Uncharacterized protein n=1 Tax=Moniliophthora roreri (strain MCA 2997) TaxID=1381753 RepID=V2XH46_MONRO|nr:hypothetical protein Moror_8945 [Moniliophthora roreri MCA 2997]